MAAASLATVIRSDKINVTRHFNLSLRMTSMKQAVDKNKRGRPVTGNAMSNAERQKAYRDRKREARVAIAHSRNALQELPDDGSPRRLLAELDRAQRAVERLTQENHDLKEQLRLAKARQKKA